MSAYESHLAESRERHLAELDAFLRIPSISTLPEHAADLARCADWVADELASIGLHCVEQLDTGGNPIVYGELARGRPGRADASSSTATTTSSRPSRSTSG